MTQLDDLRKPFTASEVKQREGPGNITLDYVAIETVLNRVLDVAPDYSWMIVHTDVRALPVSPPRHSAVVTGRLLIGDKFGDGIGAMIHADLDMAVKSANSEAIKNAAKNGFGIALELWDAEHRDNLAEDRAAAAGDVTTLKALVNRKFKDENGGNPAGTAQEVADHFNVTVIALNDVPTLKGILGL